MTESRTCSYFFDVNVDATSPRPRSKNVVRNMMGENME